MTEKEVQTGRDPLAHWQRLYEGTRQMLARALCENRVHAECLEIARKTLRGYANLRNNAASRQALAEIEARLAELETNDD